MNASRPEKVFEFIRGKPVGERAEPLDHLFSRTAVLFVELAKPSLEFSTRL